MTHTSSTGANLFTFELNYSTADSARLSSPISLTGRTTNSYVGDIASVDWDQSDEYHDAVYFGTVESTPVTTTDADGNTTTTFNRAGDLRRFKLSNSTQSVMLSAGLPIMLRPHALTDTVNVESIDPVTSDTITTPTSTNYVTVGTGQTITDDDLSSTQTHYQYSVIEEVSSGSIVETTYSTSDLKDISGIAVSTTGVFIWCRVA